MEIRELAKEEYGAALDLAWEVFQKFEAPDYAPQGVKAFYASIHDPDYLAQLRIYSAFDGDALIGILATRSGGTHIALFFVRGAYHRQGVGRQLFFRACRENSAGQMTVNSSPYAVEVYRRLGFCETDAEQTTDGIRYTPMSNLQMEEEVFAPQDYEKPQLDFADMLETMQTRIKIRIHKSVMDRMLDYCAYEDFSLDGDEHFIVDFPFLENEYYYDIFLSFGDKCECLEPPHVRAELKQRIQEIAALYA